MKPKRAPRCADPDAIARAVVEAALGGWPTRGCPTDGWLRSAIEAMGTAVRGRDLTRAELMRIAHGLGLDLHEPDGDPDERAPDAEDR